MTRISLAEINAVARSVSPNKSGYIEGLGGNVYAVCSTAHTLTIDDGVRAAEAPAELLVCLRGAEVLRTEIRSAAEVGPLLLTIPTWDTYGELPALHALRTSETPTERAILANFLIAAGWADAVGSDGEQVTASIDADDITADDETWVEVRTMIRAFLAELAPRTDEVGVEAHRIVHTEPEQAGHDLWLTMRHHGAGFWDRGYPEGVGELLTELAERHGSEGARVVVNMTAEDFGNLGTEQPVPIITLYFRG